jgi:shingomyelin synthase
MTLLLSYRIIIFRRIFFLGGLHYLYRAITMYVTVLPKPDPNYACTPRSGNLTVLVVVERVVKVLSGFGLTTNGEQVYCGDYIYSGHTMILIMTYLIIYECKMHRIDLKSDDSEQNVADSPKKWQFLHWLSFSGTVVGIITLLCSRGHYSIDVLIAYWITTRLWWIYHTMANNSKICDKENKHSFLDRFWWWPIFMFLEKNVKRPLPKGFNWPLPECLLSRLRRIPCCVSIFGRSDAGNDARSEESRSTRISDPELGLANRIDDSQPSLNR